jgi:hypothetical protein
MSVDYAFGDPLAFSCQNDDVIRGVVDRVLLRQGTQRSGRSARGAGRIGEMEKVLSGRIICPGLLMLFRIQGGV